jgi:hypothetical protein
MIFYWESIVLIIGFVIGYILYYKYRYRGGGVIAVPLLVIYTIKFPLMLPLLLISTFLSFFILNFLYLKFIIYGRRLLYISLTIGIVLNLIIQNSIKINMGWYPLILTGLLSYNMHREINSGQSFFKSSLISIFFMIFMIIIAFIMIYMV